MDKFVIHLLNPERNKMEDPEKFLPSIIHGVVAELGCGPGYYCQFLVKYAEKVYCVDRNKELLEIAKELAKMQYSLMKTLVKRLFLPLP
jgi:protein-L-isoaspartate O-methyltransferase